MRRDVGILFGLFVMYVRENHVGGKNAKQQKNDCISICISARQQSLGKFSCAWEY